MRQDPAVSVVIPVYNCAPTLARALDSVLAQDYKDIEIVVVNDGSTDEFDSVIRRYAPSSVQRIDHARRQGAAAARNTGIRAARGRYVAFLDADDEWLPGKLSAQVRALDAAPSGAWIVCTGYYIHREASAVRPFAIELRQPPEYPESLAHLVWGCDLSPGSTLICRKELFERAGVFDEKLERLEDWDWLLRCATDIHIRVLAEPMVRIYIRTPPARARVLAALSLIEHRHLGRIAHQSQDLARIFRSTIEVEKAAANYNHGRYLFAVAHVLWSLRHYRHRNRQFFRRIVKRAATFPSAPETGSSGRPMHVITGLHIGGAESALTSLVLAMHRQREAPIVVALIPGGRNFERLRSAGVDVHSLDLTRRVFDPIRLTKALIHLIRLIRRFRPSVVQSWMYHADLMATIALLLSGRMRRTRLFWGIRCSNMDIQGVHGNLRWIVRICAWLSPVVDGVVSNSEAGIAVHRDLGYRPPRFALIDNGFSSDALAQPQETRTAVRGELGVGLGTPLIAAVARVDAMKDYGNLLAAVAQVDDVETLAIGLGTERLADLPRLHRLGQRSDVVRLLSACDMAVSSSAFGEGFSNAIAEAMSCGLPVIATDVGDARRIIGDTGIIVPPRNSRALADAIRTLARDPRRRAQLGQLAQERIRTQFSMDRMVRGFAALHMANETTGRPGWVEDPARDSDLDRSRRGATGSDHPQAT